MKAKLTSKADTATTRNWLWKMQLYLREVINSVLRIGMPLVMLIGLAILIREALKSTSMLSVNEESNSGKLGHIKSFFEQLTVPILILGRGLSNWLFSACAGGLESITEVSPSTCVR